MIDPKLLQQYNPATNLPGSQQGGISPFPANFYSNLASIMQAYTGAQEISLDKKKQRYQEMLTQAKEFGIAGVRKLYDDPTFQGLTRDLKINLPNLPPPSPEELKADRVRAFYSRMQQVKNETMQKAGGRELTPKELRDINTRLGAEFPDIAGETGLAKQELTAGPITALIRAATDPNVTPDRFVLAFETAQRAAGLDPDSQSLDEKKLFAMTEVSPLIQARINSLNATAQQKIAGAALTDQKRNELLSTYNLRIQEMQAKVQNLLANGQYKEAAAEFMKVKTEFEPQFNALKTRLIESQIDINAARYDLYKTTTSLRNAQIKESQARYNYWNSRSTPGMGGTKLQIDSLRILMTTTLNHIKELDNQILLSPDEETQKVLTQLRSDKVNELNDYTKELGALQQRLKDEKPNPGDNPPPKGDNLTSPIVGAIFNGIMQVDPSNWKTEFSAARSPAAIQRYPQIKDMTPEDWNTLYTLLAQAYRQRTGKNFGEATATVGR